MIRKYSYSEFAEMCGVTPAIVRVNKGRGKIIVDENKKIDILDPTNKAFLDKSHNSIPKLQKVGETENVSQPPQKSKPQKKNDISQFSDEDLDYDLGKLEKYGVSKLQRIKLITDIEKVNQEKDLKRLEYAKKKKKVVPIDFTDTAMNTLLAGTVAKVKNEFDKFIENEFEDNEIALEHKKFIHNMVDECIKKNLEYANKENRKEAEDYSLKTGW